MGQSTIGQMIAVQLLLFVFLRVSGFAFLGPLAAREGRRHFIFASFHAGAAAFAACFLAFLFVGGAEVALVAALIMMALMAAVVLKLTPVRLPWRVLAGFCALDAGIIGLVTLFDRTKTTFDSIFYYFSVAEAILAKGLAGNPLAMELFAWSGYFYGLFQVVAGLADLDFFPALAPLFGIHLAIGLTAALRQRLRAAFPAMRRPWLWSGLLLLPLFTCPFYHVNTFYVNHHMMSAGYVFWGFYLITAGLKDQERLTAVYGAVILCAWLMMRLEAKPEVLMLAAAVFSCRRKTGNPGNHDLIALLLCCGVFLCCLADLAMIGGHDQGSLVTPARIYLMMTAALALGAAAVLLLRRPNLERFLPSFLPKAPELMVVLFLAVLANGAWNSGKVVPVSADAMAKTLLLSTGDWSLFIWWLLALTVICLPLRGKMSLDAELALKMIMVYLVFTWMLPVFTGMAYHISWADSANRMMFHFAPLAAVFCVFRVLDAWHDGWKAGSFLTGSGVPAAAR